MPTPPKVPSCTLVVFGASGDLTHRLLAPALYNLAVAGRLPEQFAVVGMARKKLTSEEFRTGIVKAIREQHGDQAKHPLDEAVLKKLAAQFQYLSGDPSASDVYPALIECLEKTAHSAGIGSSVLFYLATPPALFEKIPPLLAQHGLLREEAPKNFRRVVFEKPFGRNLASARALNASLGELMQESQIYRIDHYLGKETVQNILVMRFANGIFEPLWNRRYIESVEINVDETLGVEKRAAYYETSGALRDMVPNHLFQLVALIGMEAPNSFSAEDVRDEKVKLLRAIPPITAEKMGEQVVRGQYEGYRKEPDVAADSRTETFVGLKLGIENWRWAGVPFYLRTGKRLTKRSTEIVIRFKCPPFRLFGNPGDAPGTAAAPTCAESNKLTLGIQPKEAISLSFSAKIPGPQIAMQEVAMNFDYESVFGQALQTGYETLLYDAMIGDPTLFQRADQVEAAWTIVDPILQVWDGQKKATDLASYAAGSAGPQGSGTLEKKT